MQDSSGRVFRASLQAEEQEKIPVEKHLPYTKNKATLYI
jgi:hypothetical protein